MKYTYTIEDEGVIQHREDGKESLVLLDFKNHLGNYSHLLLSKGESEPTSIPNLLDACLQDCQSLPKQVNEEDEGTAIFLANVFLFRLGMRGYRPLRVLELGSSGGNLGYYLAKHASALHSASRVYCLSEVLPGDHWMSILAQMGAEDLLGSMNLLTTAQDSDALRSDYYDFTVVHDVEAQADPEAVLQNALRVTKLGGYLVVLSRQPALRRGFERYCKAGTAYPAGEQCDVLFAEVVDKMKQAAYKESAEGVLLQQLQELVKSYDAIVEKGPLQGLEQDGWAEIVQRLSRMEETCILLAETADLMEVKLRLVEAKEMVLNRMYTEFDDQRTESEREYDRLMGIAGGLLAGYRK